MRRVIAAERTLARTRDRAKVVAICGSGVPDFDRDRRRAAKCSQSEPNDRGFVPPMRICVTRQSLLLVLPTVDDQRNHRYQTTRNLRGGQCDAAVVAWRN